MPGVNSILDIGRLGLFAAQAALEIAGNNIANVNTEGYSRRTVSLEETMSIDYRPGQIGTGVVATEVIRHFDSFIEEEYISKSSYAERWDTLWQQMRGVENLFNESSVGGLNEALAQFWEDWQDLSLRPEDVATREALLGDTQNLLSAMHTVADDLVSLQAQMDEFIIQETANANDLISEIASLNGQIAAHDVPGQNNANSLIDRRSTLVRELASIMDLDIIDNGSGDYVVMTTAGHTLVDGVNTFDLKFEGAKTFADLSYGSSFDGDIYFEGQDEFEYTVEVLSGGAVSNGSGGATFRVSLDGGKSWLKDDDGNEMVFNARDADRKVTVGDLTIWFGQEGDNTTAPLTDLQAGDTFTIVPKSGLYWYENTAHAVNITPEISMSGMDNDRRIVGGSLGGYFTFRDYFLGRYSEKLDAMAEALTWEVNRLHSQGTGLQYHTDMLGTYSCEYSNTALASNSTGLTFGSKLASGSAMFYFYDAASGDLASNASFGAIDFSSVGGTTTFNPDLHSLEDVRDAINDTFGTYMTAEISNNQLRLTAENGFEFAMGTDSTGLFAALGLNTFFQGSSAADIAVHADVNNDVDLIAAGHANGAGEGNEGDNSTAVAIGELQHKEVSIRTAFEASNQLTIQEYFNTLVSTVGGDTANAEFNYNYFDALADDLNARQEEMAGVNLDEEMAALIKFQHAYTAAAKVIQAADEMLQVVLGLKG